MKNLIYPSLKEGYVSQNLQRETAERTIPLLPIEGERLSWYQRLWLRLKVVLKKVNKLW